VNAKVKTALSPSTGFIDCRRVLRSVLPRRINCRWNLFSLTNGPHHDHGGHVTARTPSSRRRNGWAVAGGHIRLPTPPTTRVAAAPEKARPRREITVATASIKWPGPLLSKEDPRTARAPGSKKFDPQRVQIATGDLEAHLKQTGATGALGSQKTTDQQHGSRHGQTPSKPADAKDGSTQLLPRTALLIGGSKPDLDGFGQAPQITRVRDNEGACIQDFPRAHRLEGAPHVVFESQ
jgi:hypothetical protein